MKLIGVTPIGRVTVTSQGMDRFKFNTPYGSKVLNSINGWKKYLKSINKSFTQLILDINGIELSDLPKCKCGNTVRIQGSLLTPRIREWCTNSTCAVSGAQVLTQASRTREERRLLVKKSVATAIRNGTNVNQTYSSDRRVVNARKSAYKTLANGTHPFSISSEDRSNLSRQICYDRLEKGTHPSQTGKTKYAYLHPISNKVIYFNSKVEISIYKKFREFFDLYYSRELKVCSYELNGVIKGYSADYKLKLTSENLSGIDIRFIINNALPDIIEVKSGNLFWDSYKKSKVKLMNYLKFKSVIDNSMSILILDKRYVKTPVFKFISNHKELDELFEKESYT